MGLTFEDTPIDRIRAKVLLTAAAGTGGVGLYAFATGR